MENSPLRRALAVALLAVLTAMTASDLCHGWSANADGRKACCARTENTCARLTADDCCAQGEQRKNREIVPSIAQPSRDMTVGPLVSAADPFDDADIDQPNPGTRPRPHLLHSVFLI